MGAVTVRAEERRISSERLLYYQSRL